MKHITVYGPSTDKVSLVGDAIASNPFAQHKYSLHFLQPEMEEAFMYHHYLNGLVLKVIMIGTSIFTAFIFSIIIALGPVLESTHPRRSDTGWILIGCACLLFIMSAARLWFMKDIRKMELAFIIGFMTYIIPNTYGAIDADQVVELWYPAGCLAYMNICTMLRSKAAAISTVVFTAAVLLLMCTVTTTVGNEHSIAGNLLVMRLFLAFAIPLLFPFITRVIEKLSRTTFIMGELTKQKIESVKVEMTATNALLSNLLPNYVLQDVQQFASGQANGWCKIFNVAVFQLDIVNFTLWTRTTSISTVTKVLRSLYLKFDEATSVCGAEKVTTVGDAYVSLCNHPETRVAVRNMLLVAIRYYKLCRSVNTVFKQSLQLRSGLHVGPLVGGLVSFHSLAYDYYGETLTVVQDLEQSSVAGCIHISREAMLAGELATYLPSLAFAKGRYESQFGAASLLEVADDLSELLGLETLKKETVTLSFESVFKIIGERYTSKPAPQYVGLKRMLLDLRFNDPAMEKEYERDVYIQDLKSRAYFQYHLFCTPAPLLTLVASLCMPLTGHYEGANPYKASYLVVAVGIIVAEIAMLTTFWHRPRWLHSTIRLQLFAALQLLLMFLAVYICTAQLETFVAFQGARGSISDEQYFFHRETFVELTRCSYMDAICICLPVAVYLPLRYRAPLVWLSLFFVLFTGPLSLQMYASASGGLLGTFLIDLRKRQAWKSTFMCTEENSQMCQARKTSEQILFKLIPEETALRLKGGEIVRDSFDEVIILFFNIANLEQLVAELSPEELINLIRALYSRMDKALSVYPSVAKIKHTSSVSMFALGLLQKAAGPNLGGPSEISYGSTMEAVGAHQFISQMETADQDEFHAPTDQPDKSLRSHAKRLSPDDYVTALRFAIDVVNQCKEVSTVSQLPIKFGVGIHVGPTMACVLGKYKMCYDTFGTSVNTAARLAKCKELPNQCINASDEFCDKISPKALDSMVTHSSPFSFEAKGIGQVKSKILYLSEHDSIAIPDVIRL